MAQLKSFTKAASQLSLSQPAVSSQIKALEEDLQISLFERNERGVVLTEAGRFLYTEASQLIRNYHKIRASLDELRGLKTGHLLLGASTVPGECLLPQLIGGFREKYPGIRVSLRVGNSDTVAGWLKEKEVDFGLLGNVVEDKGVESTPWVDDPLVVVTPPWHPVAGQEVSIKDIMREPFIVREPGSATRAIMEQRLLENNILLDEFPNVLELGSNQAIINAVRAGLGVGVISWWTARDWLDNGLLEKINISGLEMRHKLYVAWSRRKNEGLTSAAFRSFILNKDIYRRFLQVPNSSQV